MVKRKWVCIEVRCHPERADDLASEMAAALEVGVEVLANGVRFYLTEEYFQGEGEQRLDDLLTSLEPLAEKGGPPPYTLSTLVEEDWMEQWKRDFKPLRVGKHLVVAPTWEEVIPGPDDRIIWIDPGQAFGTGHHETTRLCLEWLETWTETRAAGSSKSLLDVGTGSGILAIAAALLGFERILGLDNDPEAIPVARENLILNRVSDKVVLQVGTVEAVPNPFEVVLANIQALPLIEMAPLLAQRLEEGGRLALSGILVEQAEAVQRAYEAQDLKLRCRNVAGEWCLMEFERSKGREESCHTKEKEPGLPRGSTRN